LHPKPFFPQIHRMKEQTWQTIELPDEGGATVFTLCIAGVAEEGFAVRFSGRFFAYLNRCPHNGSTLDWVPGRFFSEDEEVLVCQTHGALFAPDSGNCLSGPCPRGLTPLPLREEQGTLLVPTVLDVVE
jgi:nitrite reductase/ring-hydroxylating ferredoxin subunit